MRLEDEQICAFVGKRGTGKSYRAKALVGSLRQRVLAFDYHDEHSRAGHPAKAVNLGALRERLTVEQLCEDTSVLDAPDLSLAIVPRRKPREAAEDFQLLAELVLSTGELVLVADEVGHWGEYAQDELNELACQSRHSGVPLVLIAQRAMQIPKTTRTQLTVLNSGRQDDPGDLDALASVAGREFAERVRKLARREFEEWRDEEPGRAKKDGCK